MKTKFYNTHTKADDINDLDPKWLKKQLSEQPYDVQYKYLKALLQMNKGEHKSYIDSLGKLLFDTNGVLRIGALLQRSEEQKESPDNVLDSVSIKSKKSVKTIKSSSILAGITEVNPKLYKKSKSKKKSKKSDVLEIDFITVEDDNNTIVSQYNYVADDDDEEEEFVSASVPDNTVVAEVVQPTQPVVITTQTPKESRLSRSELVEIEHSAFTTWLQSLPSIDSSRAEVVTDESNNEAISEPLARLLGAQGHKADAIVMYKQLMLKYPEKSSFFADQIKKLS
jgi:hypothetical protein